MDGNAILRFSSGKLGSCSYEDALGRTICETHPGFRGALLITSNEYNTANQLIATRTYVLNENFGAAHGVNF